MYYVDFIYDFKTLFRALKKKKVLTLMKKNRFNFEFKKQHGIFTAYS
jgi:hypothetical protein